jgi:flagellar basal body-associated protein FliL
LLHAGAAEEYQSSMETEKTATPAQQILIMWILWAAFLVGACMQYFFLHQKSPPAADGSNTWLAAFAPVAASLFIRWSLLPRVTVMQSALVLLILGVTLAESALFFGMFVFSAHQSELFLAALLGIAQHAPVYARRLVAPPPGR